MRKYLLLFAHLAITHSLIANNIAVSNIVITGQNNTAGSNNLANYTMVQFNLGWDNSWRWNSSGGSLSYIAVKTGGSGYTSAPTISITGGGGSGATATASISGGAVSGITITNAGSGYTSVPAISFSGGGGSGSTADAHITSWWDAAWVFVKFRVGSSNPTFTGVNSSGTTITVNSTTNLRVGMPIRVTSGAGAFASGTVVSSITNATQFVVSATPTTALSNANVECLRIWEHARLNNTGHVAPAGSVIDAGLQSPGSAFNLTTNPAVGAFIYRDAPGEGSNSFNNIRLRWNYGANGIADNMLVTVQVFAIEMVYVPGGVDFNVGGGGGSSSFTSTTINTGVANTVPAGTGSLGGAAGGYPTGQTAPNANWPNGYNAFYCMKYEITQGQYRDFLNTLTYAQQVNRTANLPTSAAGTSALLNNNANRSSIDIQTPGNATTLLPAVYGCNLNGNTTYNEAADGEWIACNRLPLTSACAYLQWSGLRPMTELEFEKACRGNQPAVAGECAWGSNTYTQVTGISNAGTNTETFSNAGANVVVENSHSLSSPLRVGAFAGAATTRTEAGSTYYGIMEMSGNLWESAVTIGNEAGRSFTGLHGSGTLLVDGSASMDFWPGINGNSSATTANTAFAGTTGITGAAGMGYRGGSYVNAITILNISARINFQNTNDGPQFGHRGVRSAP
jgi:formylglycine-generating enzyme required for sulfatase activity